MDTNLYSILGNKAFLMLVEVLEKSKIQYSAVQ